MKQYSGKVWKFEDNNLTVAMIQSRLRQLGFLPAKTKCTGYFGESTRTAVINFQRDIFPLPKGLNHVKSRIWKTRNWDGVVGPKTWKALWPAKCERAGQISIFVSNIISKIKKRPLAGWVLNEEEKRTRYGRTILDVESNLVEITFLNKNILVHAIHAEQFNRVNNRIRSYEEAHNLKSYIPKQISSYSYRLSRGTVFLSGHSFGTSVDIDWYNNPITDRLDVEYEWCDSNKRIPQYIISSFKKEGAKWGGDYYSIKEYMHFEM